MSDTTDAFEQYSDDVLNAPAKFDPVDKPYGSELPIPEGMS